MAPRVLSATFRLRLFLAAALACVASAELVLRPFLVHNVSVDVQGVTRASFLNSTRGFAFATQPTAGSARVYATLGTNATTVAVHNGSAPLSFGALSAPIVACNGTTVIGRVTSPSQGEELMVVAWSAGDAWGDAAARVLDLAPGAAASAPGEFAALGTARVLFAAETAGDGRELWAYSCDTQTASQVRDIFAGSASSDPEKLTPSGGYVYFVARTLLLGQGLYRSDGTFAGTVRLTDLVSSLTSVLFSQRLLPIAGNGLVFGKSILLLGSRLYRSFGSDATTTELVDLGTRDDEVGELVDLDGSVVFSALLSSGVGRELYISDGSPGSVALIRDIASGSASSQPSSLTVSQSYVYFVANDGIHGTELWRSNGTAAGTELVCDIASGTASSAPHNLTALDHAAGALAFIASPTGNAGDNKVYITNGSCAGTQAVSFSGGVGGVLGALQNVIYVAASNDSSGEPRLHAVSLCPNGTYVTEGGACTACRSCQANETEAEPCGEQTNTVCAASGLSGGGGDGGGSDTVLLGFGLEVVVVSSIGVFAVGLFAVRIVHKRFQGSRDLKRGSRGTFRAQEARRRAAQHARTRAGGSVASEPGMPPPGTIGYALAHGDVESLDVERSHAHEGSRWDEHARRSAEDSDDSEAEGAEGGGGSQVMQWSAAVSESRGSVGRRGRVSDRGSHLVLRFHAQEPPTGARYSGGYPHGGRGATVDESAQADEVLARSSRESGAGTSDTDGSPAHSRAETRYSFPTDFMSSVLHDRTGAIGEFVQGTLQGGQSGSSVLDEVSTRAEAEEVLKGSLALAEAEGDLAWRAATLGLFGRLYARYREDDAALDYFNRALHFAQLSNRKEVEVWARRDLARLHRENGRFAEATQLLLRAVELAKRVCSASELADLQIEVARLLHASGETHS